ncbi:CYTH and CHAD domain-containing protein [Mycolicibacter sp. MYC123]|uniref:CYTH and CHAD domain-containing protein n=2 Tax=Mycolicibacter TaxID=1073531 RepID=A0ABU5YQ05_9MYCO|nr:MULTISPECIES: CYTH and CHAD domain-containing protein [unclassified Mycolicibacter]MEB3052158.1 CYTH and CHAD domain-containing protein [Mycolicibacter sp. MYC123]MEB3063562.1 CYTH and CHAD domain-containing protein [Mycolicibacter sp. MYC101]MEB3067886.1 CYTH and CHAD domain-containing protein [Mycolicibacter sp. MYC017]
MPATDPSTSRFREVERKFDVDASAISPSFDGIAGVARVEQLPAQALAAVYFDTPGHDLAARRITLRRRTGGPDAGWHLKLPAGPATRTEVRAPLSPEVPDELLDVVMAIVRDRPLAPVAQIGTARSVVVLRDDRGEVLAEFCDDQVIASTEGAEHERAEQHWREWELELGSGDLELLERLSNRLLDTGARPAGYGSKLARVLGTPSVVAHPSDLLHRALAEQIEQLLVADRAVRANADDAVHQMRVTIRRIRSLLHGEEAAHAPLLGELQELGAVLGGARDAEVLAQRYQQALDELSPELVRGPVGERLVDGSLRRYQSGRRRSLAAMRSPRYFRLLDGLDDLVSAPAAERYATVDIAYRRLRKAVKAAKTAADHDAALHRIRKAAKRLRYAAAAANEKKIAKRAKTIQTLLGDHQDSVVSRAHLVQQADIAAAAGQDTFTYGLLYAREADLAAQSRAALRPALRKLNRAVQ